jgi:ABC-type multidrug transport system fused ATPase/permease subunit
MYVLKGYGRNAALVKISVDGNKKITLCSRISKFIKFVDGYAYYLDNDNDLHIVRNDGKEDLVLVEDVDPRTIITDNEKIYFLRHETVGDATNNSLYSIDLEGNDIKKIIFNVDSIKEYDETNIYLNKRETEKWRIVKTTVQKVSKAAAIFFTILTVLVIIYSIFAISDDEDAITSSVIFILISLICTIISWVVYSKKKNNPKLDIQTIVNTYKVNKYYSYNKVFGEMNEVLSLGKPDFDEIYTKKKLPNESYSFTLIKNENKYYRQNVVKAGANFKEEKNKFDAQQQANGRK